MLTSYKLYVNMKLERSGDMKKTIDGSQYNTETAKMLGKYENMKNRQSPGFYSETLFLTRSGKYFLHGTGGSQSFYRAVGEEIQPMLPQDAAAWAEKHLTPEEYAKLFEDTGAEDEKVTLMAQVSGACKKKLQRIKEATGKTFGEIIEEKFMQVSEENEERK